MSQNNQDLNLTNVINNVISSLSAIKKELIIGLSLIVVFSLAYSLYGWYEVKKEYNANAEYFRIKLENQMVENDAALKEERVQEQIKAFIKDNIATTAAKTAALDLANYYDTANSFTQAYEVLSMVTKLGNKTLVDNLFRYRLALSLQKDNKCEEAITHFESIANNRDFSYLSAPSMLQQALCYESLNQNDKAVATYENIVSKYGDTEAGKQAEQFLILLNMRN